MPRLLICRLAAVTLPLLAAPLSAQPASPIGYEYLVRASEPGESPDELRVRVSGASARIDGIGERGNGKARDYLLLRDHGRQVIIVRPSERNYSELTAEEFESMLGRLLSKADKVVDVKLRNARVVSDRLGAGQPILGLPTVRGRLTQDFTVGVGALGFMKELR
jgi:hypothetical protein